MMEDPSGNVPVAVRHDLLEDIEIDDNVAAYFPPRSKFVSAIPHGTSFWTRTVRVNLELAAQANFLKIGNAEIGRNMVRGEFEGINAVYPIVPDFVPRPIGWGTYKADQNKHFYMSEFIPMREELPDPQVFCAKLAQLHRDSISLSPNGKFGFHVATYAGNMPQDVTWCDMWEESFSRGLRGFAEQEKNACGPSEDLDRLLPQLFEKVIPRLLRPLQTGGRKLKPVLIHGDLWYGDIATNGNTGAPIAFDPAVLWAHNEYELGTFNVPRYRFTRQFMQEYHKHVPMSSPEEDYEDRNLLYAIHGHFCASTLYPTSTRFREEAIRDISYLANKYPDGFQESP